MEETLPQIKANAWDRSVTIIIIMLLLMPIPFVRFESWPGGGTILMRPIMPWSYFHFCYNLYPGGEPVEEAFQFTWRGKILPTDTPEPLLLIVSSAAASPILKWQDNPELPLEDVFRHGNFILVNTHWRPILLWPFTMVASKLA